ncbi:sulfotransferase [Parasulfuritortus cantonensis]|uniref:Sulfotransferase n=1 Tax=Parasulfuritortus cantonensis TaxID=2528202 RepID=A0A4R1BLU5_9PROT|nr:sulfotransferase family 2 domain-containing protein [Parasulfuritortus cantonensis]TCJ18383.1 sulfotransferase [Parasulfuritortus cantonensis]
MLLSPRFNFLFVHIAKTGGTSVRAALERVRWRDPWYWLMWPCHRMSHLTGHRLGTKFPRHAHAIAAREMLPKSFYDSLFKFAFVRNPWDLQVSSFHHIRRERPHYMQGHDNFADFLRWKFDPERPYQFHLDTSIESQNDYLVDLHDNLIVDFVGRYEQLNEDFATICARIGIPCPELPHRRQATDRRKDYREYYDDETAALVAQHFGKDIERFGYRFDDVGGA